MARNRYFGALGKKNKKTVLTIAAFVLLALLFIGLAYIRMQAVKRSASDNVALAYQYINSGDVENAIKILDETIARFSSSTGAYNAMLIKADYLLDKNEFTEAEALLRKAASNAKPQSLRALAAYRLIYLFEQSENFEAAAGEAELFIKKYKNNFLLEDVYISLARLYDNLGNTGAAKETYSRILELYPNTEFADAFKTRIQN
jgi:predicted negative regulator of RcsB-dependent stress response